MVAATCVMLRSSGCIENYASTESGKVRAKFSDSSSETNWPSEALLVSWIFRARRPGLEVVARVGVGSSFRRRCGPARRRVVGASCLLSMSRGTTTAAASAATVPSAFHDDFAAANA